MAASVSTNKPSLVSQSVAQAITRPITHTIEKKDPIYTMTIDIPSTLPSSLVIDTSELPSSFASIIRPSSSSSSYATRTTTPMFVVIVAPVAMLLPRINA